MAGNYPFLSQAFLDALAFSGSASAEQGWEACHLHLEDSFVPLYNKRHSWGEYVFDHAWAQAYARHGLAWYPKLVTAVPYSPVTGPRWRGSDPDPDKLLQAVNEVAADLGASSWHLLFPDDHAHQWLSGLPLVDRQACHFRWINRDYADWDAFLAALTSRKRKSIRKERRAIGDQGLTVQRKVGAQIPPQWWSHFYPLYASSYLKRFQEPYLTRDFFDRLSRTEPGEQIMMVMAFADDRPVAAAFYLFDDERLYGRYWGCAQEYHALHFELCYYQGIEFAIERGLSEFDPGVQGEHKILRGFEPVITRSMHWIREPAFHDAIGRFCQQEAAAVRQYQAQARELLPYRQRQ